MKLKQLAKVLLIGFFLGTGWNVYFNPPPAVSAQSNQNLFRSLIPFDALGRPIFSVATTAVGAQTNRNLANALVPFDSSGRPIIAIGSGSAAFSDGTVALPSITFANELSSGWYRAGAGDVRLSILGVDVARAQGTGLSSAFQISTSESFSAGTSKFIGFLGRAQLSSIADGQMNFSMNSGTTGFLLDAVTNGTARLRNFAGTAGTGNLDIGAKLTAYNNVTTAGAGVSPIYAYGDVAGAVAVTASLATYTPAADSTLQVGCNVLVTTATTHSFSCDVTYTDEGNVARTMVLPMVALAGTFITTGLITNVTGAGPYESPALTIRAKAATAVTVRTSAGGTYTTVVYNARGFIKQVS